ncbi:anti-sigma-F factor Fin [Marinithermofilum abyssi]
MDLQILVDTVREYQDTWRHTMTVTYTCRYCRSTVGKIDESVNEMRLGFHWLTPEERKDIISYDMNGDTHVRVVCETCQDMLEKNPDLLLLKNPFQ